MESARFLKMPASTQCLYFHLGLNADDDGIVEALMSHAENLTSILNERQKKIIDTTLNFFGRYNAGTLVNWTHDEAGPWFKSTNGGKSLQKEIPDNLISDYFKTLIRPVN